MQMSDANLRAIHEAKSAAPRRINWWLRMTSAGWNKPQNTVEQREMTRRSTLVSWILLGLLVALLLFIPAALTNVPTIFSIAFAALGVSVAIFLNRMGLVTAAGALLVVLICIATMGVIVGSPDGAIHVVDLPAYDFLAVAVVLGAAVLPRSSAFIIAGINIAIIYADLIFQPKAQDLLGAIKAYSLATLAGRPVVTEVIIAVIAFLWARGMHQAVQRADRAEELRAIERQFTLAETERSTRVEEFVQETINAISTLANGQEGLMLLPASHPWQQQANFINTQLKQFHRLKQASRGNNEQAIFAVEALYKTLQRINSGQASVSTLDPRQFTTQVLVVDEIAKYLYFMLQGKQAPGAMKAPGGSISRPLRNGPGISEQHGMD